MEEFIELDEEKIENLDVEEEKVKSDKDAELLKLSKKLKLSRILNIVLGIILFIFISIIASTVYILYNTQMRFNPFLKHFLNYKVDVSTISQITRNHPIDLQNFANKLSFIDDVIGELYYYDKDNTKIEDGMFAGYLSSLGDKYAEYFPAKKYEDFNTEMNEGVYYGIGCIVTQDRKTKECYISQVYDDSPASKGGLKEGDVFISIDGESVVGKDTEFLVSKIKGPEGTKREIEVFRKNENKNVTCICYCGKVDIKLISHKVLDNEIGYIDIDQFTGKAATQFIDAVDDLTSQNIKGLIIDLRGNGGGELMTVLTMLDYLVRDRDGRYTLNQKEELFENGKTLLVYIKEKDAIVDSAYASDGHSVEIPMVVLTDINTASAAELFTAGLRDYKKATIVGTRTYGKGVVQNVIECDDGSAIKFTTSEYFPPSGYSINVKGILPDYSLDYDGEEILYNEDNKIVVDDEDATYILEIDGTLIEIINKETNIATGSEIISSPSVIKAHAENLKIYDPDNSFLDEEWFMDLDAEEFDKQMLQALVVLRDKLKIK